MSFSDPQVIAIGANTYNCNKVVSGNFKAGYLDPTGDVKVDISHDVRAVRTRSLYRVTMKKTIPDAMIPSNNVEVSTSAYVVLDKPNVGFTPAALKELLEGLIVELDSTNLDRFISLQS